MNLRNILAFCLMLSLIFSIAPAYALAAEPSFPDERLLSDTADPPTGSVSDSDGIPAPENTPMPESTPSPENTPAPENTPLPENTPPRESNPPTQLKAPEVLGYSVSKSSFSKGDTVTITVTLRHSDVTLSQAGGEQNLDIIKLADSFSGGSLSWTLSCKENEKLRYDLTFSQVKYNGFGKSLRFMPESRDGSLSFPSLELTLAEALEYDPSKEDAGSADSLAGYGGGSGGGYATESSVPRLVISEYDYGEKAVAAGSKFSLNFTLLNTGKLAVENIVVSIDGGESFTMDKCSNTLYYGKMPSAGKESLSVNMQALPGANSGAQSIGINCKYEYLDSGKRSNATAEIKLSIPVMQPDRFHVSPPSLPETVNAGEEQTLSLSYVNKGKAQVSNVEASIEGRVDSPAKSQYLGNFDPGKSGSIGFVFTPPSPGKLDLVLKVSYEDANQELHSLDFPLSLNVQAAPEPMYQELDDRQGNAFPVTLLWLLIPFVLISAGYFWGRLFVRKLREKQSAAPADIVSADWDSWDEAPEDLSSERARKSTGGKADEV